MKNKKILALVLAIALLVTQFAMLSSVTVSADVAALTGRNDFISGVSVHPTPGYDTYKRPYNVVLDAAPLGVKVIRTGTVSTQYDQVFADMAYKNGMQVMFVMDLTSFKDGNSFKTPAQIGDAGYTAIYNKFYAQATLLKDYDGYIQMGNELDAVMKSGNFGTYGGKNTSNYGNVDALAVAIYAAHKAVQDANTANGSNVKTVFNFAFNHYGLLNKVKNVNIDPTLWSFTSETGTVHATWDYIGLNYYSNMYDDEVYSTILSELDSNFTQKVIITESNLTPTSKSGSTIYYSQNVNWFETFVRYCYNDSNVAGFITYELYDESEREGSSFNREAYFGLINKEGNKKGTYNRLCELFSGDKSVPLAKNRSAVTAAPAKSEYAEIDLLEGVVSSEWHPYYSNTKDNLYVDLNDTPVNLSGVSCFEFDIFIEDYASFAASVAGKRINFVLSSDQSKSDNTHRARYDFASQVTGNGWNHISLDKGSYWSKDGSFTYNSVKWAMIVFQDGGSGPNPIAGQKVAIANIVASPAEIDRVPAAPDNIASELDMKGKRTDWGASTFADVTNKVYLDMASPVDLAYSNCTDTDDAARYVEFDLYVSDQAAFHSAFDSHDLRFYVSSADNRNNNRRTFKIIDQINRDGWNHISIDRLNSKSSDSTNQNAIKHVGLACYSNTSDTNPLRNVSLRIANVCSRVKPGYPDYAVEGSAICVRVRNYESDSHKSLSAYSAIQDKNENVLKDSSKRVDLSSSDQIEFDFWCGSLASLTTNLSGHTLYFDLKTKGDNNHCAHYVFTDQITNNGWNHIVLNKNGYTSKDTDTDLSKVSGFRFRFDPTSGTIPNQDYALFATNVCGTLSEINRAPAYPDYPTIPIHAAGRDYNPSSNRIAKYHYFADKPKNLDSAVNITTADNIEFDFYAGDYDTFQSTITGHPLYFVLKTAGDNSHRARYRFTNQITKSGWNHIVLNKNGYDAIGETPDLSDVRAFVFIFWNDSSSNPVDFPTSMTWRIVNVCGTYEGGIPIPLDVMPTKTSFVGATRHKVNFDAEGNYSKELAAALDVSDARMIEFDVYIMVNCSATTISLEIDDSDNNYLLYNFSGLNTGWNHLAVRINDADKIEGSIDLTDISSYYLAVTDGEDPAANETVYISNLYAADYVDGDANRDGQLNILDLVNLKRYTAGQTAKGNIIAMDTYGNDYTIDADDNTALINMLLNPAV